jgi:hypothetical protein
MSLILDSGALIALERNDRSMWRRMKAAALQQEIAATHGGIVGQAWRGRGPRSALLAMALTSIDVRPLDENLGKLTGELLARSKRNDVIDAALILLAADGDIVLTSDPDDLIPLARAAQRVLDVIEV